MADRTKTEKEKIENALNQFVIRLESLLDDYESKGDINDFVEKLKESVKKFKEPS